MEKLLDRFLRYVAIDTQSNEESESQPSEAKELDLLRLLCEELNAMGVKATLDEYGYVMGTIPSNIDAPVPAVGFIAQVDTAPDASGKDVKPQIIKVNLFQFSDVNATLIATAIKLYVVDLSVHNLELDYLTAGALGVISMLFYDDFLCSYIFSTN